MARQAWTAPTLAAVAIVGSTTLSACTNATSSCGIPYTFTMRGHAHVTVGGCAGTLANAAQPVTVKAGTTIHLKIIRNIDGSAVLPVPVPADPQVIELTNQGPGTATYAARRPGSTALNATSIFCANASNTSRTTCPTLIVTVIG